MNLTLCIKTFERPEALVRLLASIREFYPTIPVLIADDSWTPYAKGFVTVHTAALIMEPPNQGLSAGRNAMVQLAETDLVAMLDDDFVFTAETRLEKLVNDLEKFNADLVAGAVRNKGEIRHYEGDLIVKDDRLFFLRRPASQTTRMDMVFNFFVARRDALLDCPWEARYKMAEHAPFFWSFKLAGYSVYYRPDVVVDHFQIRIKGVYNKTRSAYLDKYEQYFAEQFPRGIWMAENGYDAQAEVHVAKRAAYGQITGICSTIARPDLLKVMVKTWRNVIGGPLIIVDQSRDHYAQVYHGGMTTVISTKYDIGGCQGYQLALDNVHTDYYALMEDDFILNEHSDLFLLAAIISMTPYDLIAGQLVRLLPDGVKQRQEYRGTFHWLSKKHLDVRWVEWDNPHHIGRMDIVQNFYVATTAAVRQMGGWDLDLKVCDHLGFYLRMQEAEKVVGYCPAISAFHDKQTPNSREYRQLRRTRQDYYRQKFLKKRDLDLVTGAEKMVRR